MKQNHLLYMGNGGSSVYRITPEKENDVKTILFSLAYLTPIKLPFCMSTGERERERFFIKKKKKTVETIL